jgi:hypothetical protein
MIGQTVTSDPPNRSVAASHIYEYEARAGTKFKVLQINIGSLNSRIFFDGNVT